jgi:hypothetical protein
LQIINYSINHHFSILANTSSSNLFSLYSIFTFLSCHFASLIKISVSSNLLKLTWYFFVVSKNLFLNNLDIYSNKLISDILKNAIIKNNNKTGIAKTTPIAFDQLFEIALNTANHNQTHTAANKS